jgi:hypothetical protein
MEVFSVDEVPILPVIDPLPNLPPGGKELFQNLHRLNSESAVTFPPWGKLERG